MLDGSGTGLVGLRRFTWWTVSGTAAVVLVGVVGSWSLGGEVPVWARLTCAAALAVTVVTCIALTSRRMAPGAEGTAPPVTWLVAGSAGAAVLGAVPLAFGEYGLWVLAPAITIVIISTYLPPRRRWGFIVGAAALAAVPGTAVNLASGGDELLHAAAFPPGLVVFSAWTLLGPLWVWDIAGRLDDARRLSAELAVKDERLRFAGDLHDIQGHNLQVIALKSELAARTARTDPERAATEMAEVRQLATDALQETRALVQGYRRTTLEDEISNATRVLAAADIDARMTVEPAPLPAPGRHLLGLVMREATTNVLRHSRAGRADVDYRMEDGRARLRVRNDGADGRAAAGSGLAVLAERLAAAGGELTWRQDEDVFAVTATLPVGETE